MVEARRMSGSNENGGGTSRYGREIESRRAFRAFWESTTRMAPRIPEAPGSPDAPITESCWRWVSGAGFGFASPHAASNRIIATTDH